MTNHRPPRVFVTHIGAETRLPAFDLVRKLRAEGVRADMDYEGRSLKAQMRSANRVKAPRVVIIGRDELASGTAKLRESGKAWRTK